MKEPELPFDVTIMDTEPVVITNPYSGQLCELQPAAVAVYDTIKGAEIMGLYDVMAVGLSWFREHYPEEYYVLLD